jgi:hypothetical protein
MPKYENELGVGMKIALAGRKGSGKDVCAKILADHFNFEVFSFSDQLKRIAHQHFPWLHEDYPQELKEKKIWVSPYDGKEWSPRDVWTALNVLVQIDPDILVNGLHMHRMRKMFALCDDTLMRHCIKDLRPHNPDELAYCIAQDFMIIYIENGKDPISEENLHETERDFTKIINASTGIFRNDKTGEQPFIDFMRQQIPGVFDNA